MKIQSKITLLFLALSTAILLLLNAFILYFEYQFNFEDFFKRLETRVNITSQVRLFPGEESRAYQEVRNRYLEKLDAEKEHLLKADAKGAFKSAGLPTELLDDIVANGTARYKRTNQFYAGKIVRRGADEFIVVVSASNPYGFREILELQKILFFGFAGSLIIVFFVGKVFSYYTFIPVRKLTDKVKSISSDNLHMRLDEPKGKDEIAELSLTFNNMLNRLETAFATQNNFVSNASHELRTPLTIINSEVELALNKSHLNPEQRDTLNTISSETDKLIQILNSLLLMAQSGFDGKKQNWQPVRIDELIFMTIESTRKIHPEGNIQVDFSTLPVNEDLLQVSGNSNLLRLALTNIISNACKYSQNKLVNIKLSVQNKTIVISVTDKGIGIPSTELQHIFEPFFRASNTHQYEGHGVGLPLTLNIIRLHKGSIGIRSEVDTGTELQVFLPVATT
ncbi:ATP-binding protein [Mucilaginibacter terrae]|uniref:ATP-binding protein n=1 Tax=Mucilaginibacter terrae TaxID=1955052 RepID=UPI00362C0778